ncbi:MAG: ShlB/FhaC/HecB family hemolysin secretion/activation protein [Cyanobacteria bacterium P01_A01_bin.68]
MFRTFIGYFIGVLNFGIIPLKAQATSKQISNSIEKKIKVESFKFEGNTVFSDDELLELVKPYRGKDISFEELLKIRTLITTFYNQAGYITSFAFLPKNQKIGKKGGLITMQIVEGKLEKINISGNSRLEAYIRSRIKKGISILNRDRLLKNLKLLQADPNIKTISAQLMEGSKPGKSLLNIKIKGEQQFNIETFVNNYSSPGVGRFQRGLKVKQSSLLFPGDLLELEYRNTDGSNIYSTGYSIPVNSKNGSIEFSYVNVNSNIIEEPFSDLDIIGDSRSYQFSFRQPVLQRASKKSNQELALGFIFEREESESYLLDTPFPLSEGSDEKGRTRILSFRFFQDFTSKNDSTVFQMRSQFSLGCNTNEDEGFFAWRGQVVWLKDLGNTSLLIRGDLQLASSRLASLEQISVGGKYTVRGYREAIYLSDNALTHILH